MKLINTLLSSLLLVSIASAESAAQWAVKNSEALKTINDETLAVIARDSGAMDALIAASAKPAYVAEPTDLTRLAALSQFVARPAGAAWRQAWADKLLAAAKGAGDAYIALLLLDQLRWAGYPQQAAAVKALGAAASDKAVKDMADLVTRTLTPVADKPLAPITPYAKLRSQILALAERERTPRLLQAFKDKDTGIAGAALALATQTGHGRETLLWAKELAATADPTRRTMLLDMLGARADNNAQGAVATFLTDADDQVAAAAHRALLNLNRAAYAAHLPTVLKNLPPNRQAIVRENVRQLETTLVRAALPHSYRNYNAAGQQVALEVFKERRMAEAAPMALAALDGADVEAVVAGWRLLRETAGKEQAEALVAKALATSGRVTPEAVTTLAAAARRDGTGAYAAAINKALTTANPAQRAILLEAAPRIGGTALLQAVEASAKSDNAESATAGVRALAAWADASALPALFKLAVASSDARHRTLALRGIERIFNAQPDGAMAQQGAWSATRGLPGDEESKKTIAALFVRRVNVALNKKVTTDKPTEGNNVPANLVDGTLDKAWYAGGSPARATIDLAGEYKVDSMHVTFYHQDNRTYTFTLELSGDGKAWQEVAGNTQDPKPATAEGVRLNFAPTVARFARLNVLKNTSNPSIHVLEFMLFTAADK